MAVPEDLDSAPRRAELRILHVSEAYGGGIASAINDYALRTPQFEHVLLVAHRRGKISIGRQLPGLTVHRLRTSLPAAISDIRRIVRDARIDVVHAHSSYAGMYTRLALSQRSTPIVYSPHCFGFERTDVPTPVRAGLLAVERALARRTSAFVVVGHRELLAATRLGHDVPTLMVPHLAPAVGRTDRRAGDRFRIGAVGRLCPQKDPRYFRDLVVEVRRRYPEVDVEWTWLGDGDEQMLHDLRAEGVEVTGWTSREAAMDAMGRLDLCLLTSAWEGFPFTVIEAASRRVPVLARSIPALSEEGFPNLCESMSDMAGRIAELATSQVVYERLNRTTREWLATYARTSEAVDLGSFYLAMSHVAPREDTPRLQAVGSAGIDPYSC